jgi:hypothetical protein
MSELTSFSQSTFTKKRTDTNKILRCNTHHNSYAKRQDIPVALPKSVQLIGEKACWSILNDSFDHGARIAQVREVANSQLAQIEELLGSNNSLCH